MFFSEPPQSPPLEPSQSSLSWMSFNPGDLKQDFITLPLEGALIGSVNYFYTPKATPVWPFNNESANLDPRPTTLHGSTIMPYALGAATFVLGGLTLSNDDFALGTHVRGWLHAVLLTELATSTAKVTFQRKRPFYDTIEQNGGTTTYDDRFSFFSGHASHAFSFATYSSALMIQYSKSPILSWTYAALAYSAATYIASTRVTDHAHNVSDVIAGGIVGTAIAAAVFYRVEQIDKVHKINSSNNLDYKVVPFVFNDDSNKNWFGINIDLEF
jgi:membrane-associated phospholipid phosphatase